MNRHNKISRSRNFSKNWLPVAPLLSGILLTGACGVATFDGEADLLSLQVIHPDNPLVTSQGAVLAAGSHVRMKAITKADNKQADITAVDSDDKAIIDVVDFNANQVTFSALQAGQTTIQLSAIDAASNSVFDDVIPLEVRTVASTVINNTSCKDAVIPTQSRVVLPYSMRDANDKRLTGYGYYPVSFEPAGLTVDDKLQSVEQIRILTGDSPGDFQLVSELPTSDVTLHVVDPTEITTFSLANDQETEELSTLHIEESTSIVAALDIKAADKSVCGDSEHFNVHSLTPEVCTGHISSLGSIYFLNATPQEPGTCTLDIQLLDATGTILQSQQFSLTITS